VALADIGICAVGTVLAAMAAAGRARELLRAPLPKRPPAFCTGCPERPVFSALKIAQRELGETHVAADIGCHAFATLPPFNMGNTILGYGMGLASSSAVAPMFGKRVVSILGDGGFWHSGLTAGVANAVFNRQDSVLVILENGYTSATGQQANPSTGKNPRGQAVRMSIAETVKSLGVSWLRVVNPYRVGDTLATIREAMTTAAGGLKVIIARAECQLERQRRVRPQIAAQLKVSEITSVLAKDYSDLGSAVRLSGGQTISARPLTICTTAGRMPVCSPLAGLTR
jgi:indolepyruvate ferredoxin oxidoreductase alpha subunit